MFTPPTQVEYLDARDLIPFPDHPFQVRNDDDLEQLMESIYTNGVTSPLLIWEREPGVYIILSGHRRNQVCLWIWKETGNETYLTVPVLIYRDITQDEATLIMVDENAHRERILPSERAFAYRMKLEALKRQGNRTDLTLSQFETKLDEGATCAPMVHKLEDSKTRSMIAQQNNTSREQVRRYIRLTYLIPTLLKMVDEDHLGFRAGVEISYLSTVEQEALAQAIATLGIIPNLKQAQKLKAAHQDGTLTGDVLLRILQDVTMVDRVSFRLKPEQLERLDKLSTDSHMKRSEALRILTETGEPVYIGRDVVGEIHDVHVNFSRVGNLIKMRQNRLDLIADNPLLVEHDREAVRLAIEENAQFLQEMEQLRKTMLHLCQRVNRELDQLNAGGRKPS